MSEISYYHRWSLIDILSEFISWVALPTSGIFAISLWLTRSQVVAVYSGSLTFGFAALWLWHTTSKRRNAKQMEQKDIVSDDKPIKSFWNGGAELFSADWVLKLSDEVPKISIAESSMFGLRQKLEDYYRKSEAAMLLFIDGTYLVGCDGSMCKISEEEDARLSGYMHVRASIDFAELPYVETIRRHLEAKPTTFVEEAKNCVLLGMHAHGTSQKNGGTEFDCMPRFAARDGKVIVESC